MYSADADLVLLFPSYAYVDLGDFSTVRAEMRCVR